MRGQMEAKQVARARARQGVVLSDPRHEEPKRAKCAALHFWMVHGAAAATEQQQPAAAAAKRQGERQKGFESEDTEATEEPTGGQQEKGDGNRDPLGPAEERRGEQRARNENHGRELTKETSKLHPEPGKRPSCPSLLSFPFLSFCCLRLLAGARDDPRHTRFTLRFNLVLVHPSSAAHRNVPQPLLVIHRVIPRRQSTNQSIIPPTQSRNLRRGKRMERGQFIPLHPLLPLDERTTPARPCACL